MSPLPSGAGGAVTQEVAYVETQPEAVAVWLQDGLGSLWSARSVTWASLEDAAAHLCPSAPLSRYAAIPVGSWTLILNNGPRGTDVGLLPSQAARELGCRAVRAVCVEDDDPEYPARILELYGPKGHGPLLLVRSIVAANDGGKWVFETTGEQLPFERPDRYSSRRKTDRFTSGLLYEYLRQLHVPIDAQPDWAGTVLVEMKS